MADSARHMVLIHFHASRLTISPQFYSEPLRQRAAHLRICRHVRQCEKLGRCAAAFVLLDRTMALKQANYVEHGALERNIQEALWLAMLQHANSSQFSPPGK